MTGSAVPSGAMKKLGVFHPGPLTTAHVPMCRTLENYFVVRFLLSNHCCLHPLLRDLPIPSHDGRSEPQVARSGGGGGVAQAFPVLFCAPFLSRISFVLLSGGRVSHGLAARLCRSFMARFRSACGLFGRTKEVPLCRPCTTWHVKKASGVYLGHCCFRARFVAVFVVVCDTTPRPFWFVTSQPQVTSGWPRQRRTSTSWMPLPMLSR